MFVSKFIIGLTLIVLSNAVIHASAEEELSETKDTSEKDIDDLETDESRTHRSFQSDTSEKDNRCFLAHGGSRIDLFVRESSRIGQIIGQIDVIGDVDRNIRLRIIEQVTASPSGEELNKDDVIVSLRPGTKQLVLVSEVDKERDKGPDYIEVTVICEKIESERKDFSPFYYTIPVSVRVQDVNDNTPVFVSHPYSVNISESAQPGTRIFDGIKAFDVDRPGPYSTIEYSVDSHNNNMSDVIVIPNPLEGAVFLNRTLDYESVNRLTFGIIARDQGGMNAHESRTTLELNIQDVDDNNPMFELQEYYLFLKSPSSSNSNDDKDIMSLGRSLKVKPTEIHAFDRDRGLNSPVRYEFLSRSNEYQYFGINSRTGDVFLKSAIPEDVFKSSSTLVIRAVQVDNRNRFATTSLIVKRDMSPDNERQAKMVKLLYDPTNTSIIHFNQKVYTVSVTEGSAVGQPILTLTTNKPFSYLGSAYNESDLKPKFYYKILETIDEFSIDQEFGEVIVSKKLDFESQVLYKFSVELSLVYADKIYELSTCQVIVHVVNENEYAPEFKFPAYKLHVSASPEVVLEAGFPIGQIEAVDEDGMIGQHHHQMKHDETDKESVMKYEIDGDLNDLFEIDSKGQLFVNNLRSLNSTSITMVITAIDSGSPSRQSSVPVTVTFSQEIIDHIRHINDLDKEKSVRKLANSALLHGTAIEQWIKEQIFGPDSILNARTQYAITILILTASTAIFLLVIITFLACICKQCCCCSYRHSSERRIRNKIRDDDNGRMAGNRRLDSSSSTAEDARWTGAGETDLRHHDFDDDTESSKKLYQKPSDTKSVISSTLYVSNNNNHPSIGRKNHYSGNHHNRRASLSSKTSHPLVAPIASNQSAVTQFSHNLLTVTSPYNQLSQSSSSDASDGNTCGSSSRSSRCLTPCGNQRSSYGRAIVYNNILSAPDQDIAAMNIRIAAAATDDMSKSTPLYDSHHISHDVYVQTVPARDHQFRSPTQNELLASGSGELPIHEELRRNNFFRKSQRGKTFLLREPTQRGEGGQYVNVIASHQNDSPQDQDSLNLPSASCDPSSLSMDEQKHLSINSVGLPHTPPTVNKGSQIGGRNSVPISYQQKHGHQRRLSIHIDSTRKSYNTLSKVPYGAPRDDKFAQISGSGGRRTALSKSPRPQWPNNLVAQTVQQLDEKYKDTNAISGAFLPADNRIIDGQMETQTTVNQTSFGVSPNNTSNNMIPASVILDSAHLSKSVYF